MVCRVLAWDHTFNLYAYVFVWSTDFCPEFGCLSKFAPFCTQTNFCYFKTGLVFPTVLGIIPLLIRIKNNIWFTFDYLQGFFLGPGDVLFPPGAWSSGITMLDQQVTGLNLKQQSRVHTRVQSKSRILKDQTANFSKAGFRLDIGHLGEYREVKS